MKGKRKICVISGTRAEYGLLYWIIREIQADPELSVQLIVTGMHLSQEFGLTYKQIEEDGVHIDRKVEILLSSDTDVGTTKSVGIGCLGFADAFSDLQPDVVLVLGDRFEILSAVIAAMFAKIPVAHIHGGEITAGVVDENIRHAITKMANIHFPSTDSYAKRIIQMGENPEVVFCYGAPGLDNIYRLNLLTKEELETSLGFKIEAKTAIFTYHPETLDSKNSKKQIDRILKAILQSDLNVIFTKSNADPFGRAINNTLEIFVQKNPIKYKLCASLGQLKYLSLLQYVDVMIGNSSSGLLESSSFKLPVVNIGDRQLGRIRPLNVIDVKHSLNEIIQGIEKGLSSEFNKLISNCNNPYDKYQDGRVSYRIKEKLKTVQLNEKLIKKKFFDLL